MAASYTTLISCDELDKLQHALVVDCRSDLSDTGAGLRDFNAGHIPGAVFADLNTDLSDLAITGAGRHPLPSQERFAETLRQFGLDQDQQVVAYDQGPGAYAARLWWMLRWLGHDKVAVLDGGFAAWQSRYPVTTETMRPGIGNFQPRATLTTAIVAEDVTRQPGVLLDARDSARFRGEVEPVDPVAGHIPGAANRPFTENLQDGFFKPAARLREELMAVTGAAPVTCYCGSGVTATHNILAMVHAGLPEPTLYPGSWSEWVSSPDRPIATGD